MLTVDGKRLVRNGETFVIKGVNLGSWINIEGYMIGLSGTDWQIRKAFRERFGSGVYDGFFHAWHESVVSENDIARIAELGFNTVRVPFNYRYFESDLEPFAYRESGFAYLDNLFAWCERHGILVLLDFHAAPGGQNTTHPADNVTGLPLLWSTAHFQDRVVALWEEMARRYGKHPALGGYDLLNEPITGNDAELGREEQIASMNRLNHRIVEAIDAIDSEHLLVIEGDVRSSGGLSTLDPALFENPRCIPSYHHYPLASHEHSVNFEKDQSGSLDPDSLREFIRGQLSREIAFMEQVDRPMLLGEFGFQRRRDAEQVAAVVRAQLEVARELGFNWTLWAWKDVGALGLYSPAPHHTWVEFVRSDAKREPVSICMRSRTRHFDEVYIPQLGKDESNRARYDAAWNDEIRGLKRIALEYELRVLSQAIDRETVPELPRCFALENCEPNESALSVLKDFL